MYWAYTQALADILPPALQLERPSGVDMGKAADLIHWEGAVRMIAFISTRSNIVVEKSAVVEKHTPFMIPRSACMALEGTLLHT